MATKAEGQPPSLPVTSPGGHFEFHSDPWLNLHHFLYHWSRAYDAREQILRGRVKLDSEDTEIDLGDDQAAWDAASKAYLQYVDRDLLGGEGMRQLKVKITEGPGAWPDETPFTELKGVMPIYKKHWWPGHDAQNHKFVARLLPLLEAHESDVARTLADACESQWPENPVDVYVSYYSNWAGGYTSYGPNLVVMTSSREDLQGAYGLETIFHEAGHTMPLGENVRPWSLGIAEELGVDEGGAWHAILFHVTGEAVRQVVPDHVPYAEQFELWKRGSWDGLHPIIEHAFETQTGLKDRLREIHRRRAAASGKAQ